MFAAIIPETVSRQAVLVEVPVEVAVPGYVDADDSSLDGQMSEISSGEFDDVPQNENRAITFLGNVMLQNVK